MGFPCREMGVGKKGTSRDDEDLIHLITNEIIQTIDINIIMC